MPLPLNLAMTPSEIATAATLPEQIAWMSCHFSPVGQGLSDLPAELPEGSLLILDDSIPCKNHNISQIVETLRAAADQFQCCGLLLDFQRPQNAESAVIAAQLAAALPCPVAVTPGYATSLACPVFLSPPPLHIPLKKYLQPWTGREIWLEAALCQEKITIDAHGATVDPVFVPTLTGGFYHERLCCRYVTNIQENRIIFTLFDTCETLNIKLELARSLGVTRAVGLYQELGQHFTGK